MESQIKINTEESLPHDKGEPDSQEREPSQSPINGNHAHIMAASQDQGCDDDSVDWTASKLAEDEETQRQLDQQLLSELKAHIRSQRTRIEAGRARLRERLKVLNQESRARKEALTKAAFNSTTKVTTGATTTQIPLEDVPQSNEATKTGR